MRSWIGIACVAALALGAGCGSVKKKIQKATEPSIKIENVALRVEVNPDGSLKSVELSFDVSVENVLFDFHGLEVRLVKLSIAGFAIVDERRPGMSGPPERTRVTLVLSDDGLKAKITRGSTRVPVYVEGQVDFRRKKESVKLLGFKYDGEVAIAFP